jgi:hypothetical protein
MFHIQQKFSCRALENGMTITAADERFEVPNSATGPILKGLR